MFPALAQQRGFPRGGAVTGIAGRAGGYADPDASRKVLALLQPAIMRVKVGVQPANSLRQVRPAAF